MGQQEVFDYIKKKGTWVSVKELLENVDCNQRNVSRAVRKLYESQDVSRKQESRADFLCHKFYVYKAR
jgi:predicted transcriptional regulator